MSKQKKTDRNIHGKVLKVFKENPKKSYNYKQIAAKLNITDTQKRNSVIKALGKLQSEKRIEQSLPGKYIFKSLPKSYKEGVIQITSSGNAYLLMPEEDEDIFIARKNTNRALDGDTVSVYVLRTKKNGRREGEVVSVTERARKNYVGILELSKDFGFVSTRSSNLHKDFFIEKEELKDYNNGDKVIVKFKDWPARASSPFGTIIRSLGKPGQLNTEMHSIMHEYGFPEEFPVEVEEEAKKINVGSHKEEISKRKDFRKTTTFTIDPITAKDFDDALSFVSLGNGKYEIGVHIADVSHYVPINSILD